MDEPGFTGNLQTLRVAIWGLGLMGGSLAMALKGQCAWLAGVDADPAAVALAMERQVVDQAVSLMQFQAHPEALAGVDLLILAVPVRVILSVLEDIPLMFPDRLMIIDLGSTKVEIMEAMDRLPERFECIGGHPMCGKEKSSLANAEAAIYKNAPFALVNGSRTSRRVRETAEALVQAAGACVVWIDGAQHDRIVAATSHVPFLVSSALAKATPVEVKPLIGSGFRSTARLAGSSTRMMADILSTNAGPIEAALREVIGQLEEYQTLLEKGDFDRLAEQFKTASEQYTALVNGPA